MAIDEIVPTKTRGISSLKMVDHTWSNVEWVFHELASLMITVPKDCKFYSYTNFYYIIMFLKNDAQTENTIVISQENIPLNKHQFSES